MLTEISMNFISGISASGELLADDAASASRAVRTTQNAAHQSRSGSAMRHFDHRKRTSIVFGWVAMQVMCCSHNYLRHNPRQHPSR